MSTRAAAAQAALACKHIEATRPARPPSVSSIRQGRGQCCGAGGAARASHADLRAAAAHRPHAGPLFVRGCSWHGEGPKVPVPAFKGHAAGGPSEVLLLRCLCCRPGSSHSPRALLPASQSCTLSVLPVCAQPVATHQPRTQGLAPKVLELLEAWYTAYKVAARGLAPDAEPAAVSRTLEVCGEVGGWLGPLYTGQHKRLP